MKYSLKNEYRKLLKEQLNIDTKVPLAQVSSDSKIYYGTFNETSLSLWNQKDGNGGRGEYTVASHFLQTSVSNSNNFKRQKLVDFFTGLNSVENFIEGCEINLDLANDAFRTDLTTKLKQFSIDIVDLPDKTIEDIKLKKSSLRRFTIKVGDERVSSTLKTSIRSINKIMFLKNIENQTNKTFSPDVFANYDLISSVTTSGEDSKSTDVSISNERITPELKSILGLGSNDLTIEVKEISELSKNTSGGAGIRLASGSVLAAMQNDIIFCLTIICIVTNIAAEDINTLIGKYNIKNIEHKLTLGDALVSLKRNQIPSSKLSLLVNYISLHFDDLYKVLNNLIISESGSGTKQAIGLQALNHLQSMYSKMPADDRESAINSSLDSIISQSINADYLCIIIGWDSAKYNADKNTLGRGQFLLIHKDEYQNVLGLSSYQNGGTAYTSIKDPETIELLKQLFVKTSPETSPEIRKENFARHRSKPLHIRKKIFLESLKKKLISEGGLGGHMMHPYEALDMTPRQIIDRVKEYSTSQSIIEKVDGQNLFFTVEQDGTLMFARNKEDMTHDDLVTKFTGHPAELPFVEGGNAIKRGVDQWLSSAGSASEMEIREIFQPSGETKSFINFEIMHPDKPNQIIYDEKYIVFHSIVDFVNGRESAYSSNKSQRLQGLIKRMQSGVSSAGFTLASNRTVDLNQLSNVQIEDYVSRIKEATQLLQITEDEFLGDGIEKLIEKEIDELGVSISEKDLRILYDFVIYGETKSGVKIKSKDFMSSVAKYDLPKLRSIDVTSSAKALKKVQRIISPFKEIFVDLGIDLLKGVKSAYMSDDTNQMNIDLLKDKLQTAVDDLSIYTSEVHESEWPVEVRRLKPHLDKVIVKDIENIVSTAVEGGVYDHQGDLLKVTGGFAPMNQILGAAYRDKKGIFPTFKEKFMQQESNRRSLRSVFNLIY